MSEDMGRVSDGYHTFDELYFHRILLFVGLMKANPDISWVADKHEDGTMFEGDWCVAGMHLPTGDITYHIPLWAKDILDKTGVTKLKLSPPFDGHTSTDVCNRLQDWLNSEGK